MTGRPMPDPLAFEEPIMVLKKQKKDNTSPTTPPTTPPTTYEYTIATPPTPLVCPKAPSKTPLRSPARPQYTDMAAPNKAAPIVTKITINEKAINSSGGCVSGSDPNFHGVHFLTQRKRAKSSSTHFQYLVKLGEGCFGEVWKAKSFLDDNIYAVKKSKKPIWETNERSHQLQEIEKGMRLGYHPNIATVMAAWEEGGHLYIQMELCEKGSLKDKLNQMEGSMDEELLWNYIADVSRGLQHVHSNGIIHLDIKPENLLFSNENTLKICDFGVSVASGDTEGDQIYMAPELLDDKHTQAADIFSFGITIYECITGYQLPSQGQWWRNIREGNIPFPQNISISDELKNLITLMMNPDPSKRIDINGVLDVQKVREIVDIKKKNEIPNPKLRLQRKLF